jgi:hypothetical protein
MLYTTTAPTPSATTSDALLQTSRRVDWRFLLPDPALNHVAYVGQPGALLEALRQFSRSVSIPVSSGAAFDLVVASLQTRGDLSRAAELVRTGGWLYAEITRLSKRGLRLEHPAWYAGTLRRAGFDDVRMYWHWPDFERCVRILPLDDPAALLYMVAQGKGARLKAAAARTAMWSGALPWVISCVSVVAHRGESRTR